MRKGLLIAIIYFLIVFEFATAQNVGIGTNTPHPSATLEISSNNGGLLLPRLTFSQRSAISNPATGLIVWCIDCGTGGELSIFNSTEWRSANITITSSAGTPPLAPTNLSVLVSSPLSYSTLTWTDISTNEEGYKIERKTGNGIFTYIGQVSSNVTTFYDSTISQSTIYTYRVYAFNSAGYSAQYSNEFQLITYSIPTLNTNNILNITTNSAVSGGIISTTGGVPITSRGVCWSLSANPTVDLTTKTINGSGTGSYTSNIFGLTPNTTYHVRAYATNNVGTAYGPDSSFVTLPELLPVVITNSITAISINSAVTGGFVSSQGNISVTSRGVCWSTSSNPTIDLSTKTIDGSGAGTFSSSISGLSPNTTYYVRAYATNSVGTTYGADEVFTTLQISLPTVTTTNVSSITNSTAISGGNVSLTGNLPVTARGVCWSTSPNPTVALSTKTIIGGSGVGTFSSGTFGLSYNTTYYLRAYATNSLGTGYGAEVTFTTLPLSLGQTYAGGIIFYLDSTNQHGLVCAPMDQGSAPWGCQGTFLSGTNESLGSGSNNTSIIISLCNSSNIAAKICDNLILGGYSDWYMPSLDELRLMYQKLKVNGIGNFSNSHYWTSTEADSYGARKIWFSDGVETYFQNNLHGKNFSSPFRAVRSF